MPNFMSKREREMVDRLEHESLHHGYWGSGMPFVWQRRLYEWWEGVKDAAKTRHCRRNGHSPGVIWMMDGLPYPPHRDHMGKWDATTCGGGLLEFRGFCTHCWSHYALPWPRKNPDLELESYVHENYPGAIYLDLRGLASGTMHDMVRRELDRINKALPPGPD